MRPAEVGGVQLKEIQEMRAGEHAKNKAGQWGNMLADPPEPPRHNVELVTK